MSKEEKLKGDICKMVCDFLRQRKVDPGTIAATGIKIMTYGNVSPWLEKMKEKEK